MELVPVLFAPWFALSSTRELGENMTDDELRAMIDEFDVDRDGESKY